MSAAWLCLPLPPFFDLCVLCFACVLCEGERRERERCNGTEGVSVLDGACRESVVKMSRALLLQRTTRRVWCLV